MILEKPPKGWKRPAMGDRVKIAVLIRQGLCCAELGNTLTSAADTFFDHRPPVEQRTFDTQARRGLGDTIPPCNDPNYIDACSGKGHDVRTNGPGGEKRITTLGSDTHTRKKIRNLSQDRYVSGLKPDRPPAEPKPKHRWAKRPFNQKRKG